MTVEKKKTGCRDCDSHKVGEYSGRGNGFLLLELGWGGVWSMPFLIKRRRRWWCWMGDKDGGHLWALERGRGEGSLEGGSLVLARGLLGKSGFDNGGGWLCGCWEVCDSMTHE